MNRAAALALLTLAASGAMADDAPPAEFFRGLYDVIGIAKGQPFRMALRLEPEGAGLAVRLCNASAEPETLAVDTQADSGPFMGGSIGGLRVSCEYFIDWDNYPLLACYGLDGQDTRLTLWPDAANFAEGRLDCPS
jgi:hypothetical protein